jgi:acyl-CoA reductase-like NAD-dependent aldehyde dehydrogenase
VIEVAQIGRYSHDTDFRNCVRRRLKKFSVRWKCPVTSTTHVDFPLLRASSFAGPDLMAGDVLIVKHAPCAPVLKNYFWMTEQSAKAIADSRIKGVALTGSERAGSAVLLKPGRL